MPESGIIKIASLIVAFLVPGIVISWIRERFITGRPSKRVDLILSCLALSMVYYGAVIPFVAMTLKSEEGVVKVASWWCLVVLGPSIFGLSIGLATQKGWFRRVGHRLGINPIHSIPSSWDWRFANCQGDCFVMVTLSDGSIVAGIFGAKSFSSSDQSERDIYLEEIWDSNDDGPWVARPGRTGILIPHGEIRYIQFFGE